MQTSSVFTENLPGARLGWIVDRKVLVDLGEKIRALREV